MCLHIETKKVLQGKPKPSIRRCGIPSDRFSMRTQCGLSIIIIDLSLKQRPVSSAQWDANVDQCHTHRTHSE